MLTKANILLVASAGFLVVYLFLNIKNAYYPRMQAAETKEIQLPALQAEVTVNNQGALKSKPLFNTYVKAKLQGREDYVLLGISIGEKSLAMIKDTVANKDYYCTEGDKVGPFRVKRIFKDKVIMESDQDTIVLTQ